jgi:hypothetical protein
MQHFFPLPPPQPGGTLTACPSHQTQRYAQNVLPQELSLITAFLLSAPTAWGQANLVTMTLVPDSLPRQRAVGTSIEVVIRNGGSTGISDLRLTVVPPARPRWVFTTPRIPDLGGNAATVTQLRIEDADSSDWSGVQAVSVRLDYRQKGDGGPGVVYAPLKIVRDRLARAEDVAEAQLISTLSYLADRGDGVMHVQVRNKSDGELTVLTPSVTPIPGMTITRDTAATKSTELRIAPYSMGVYSLRVQTGDRVRPGKHLIVVSVPLRWRSGTTTVEQTLVLSREIEIGVLGESELLKLLGIPSLFFLPGVLAVLMFGFLWKYVPEHGRPRGQEFPIKAATAEFWLLALGLSLLVGLASYLFKGLRLVDYGLFDIAVLWMESIGVSAGVYLLWRVFRGARIRRQEQAAADARSAEAENARQKTPTLSDKPLQLLDRLAFQGMATPSRIAKVSLPQGPVRLFQLMEGDPGKSVWVAPPVAVTWNDDADYLAERKALDGAIAGGMTADIAGALHRHGAHLTLTWLGNGVDGPRLVNVDAVGALQDGQFIQVD